MAGTGRGRVVDVNLVDSVFSLMEGMLPEYALDGRVRQPVGAAIPTASPTNTYPCADGKWLCIAGNSDLIFARLMEAIGRPELAREPGSPPMRPLRPARGAGRRDRRLDPHPAGQEAEELLDAADVPCSRLYDIADCAADPHFLARKSVQEIDDPLIGRTLHPGPGDPPGRRSARGGGRLARAGGGRPYRYVLQELLGLPPA